MKISVMPVIVLLLAGIISATVVRAPSAQSASTSIRSSSLQAVTVSTRSGRINENYSYEDLEVERGSYQSRKHGGRVYSCSFNGKIINTAHTAKRNVKVLFAARNNFKELLWEAVVSIKSLPASGTHEFSEKISCQERDPFSWEITVIEEEPPDEKK